MYIIYPQRRQVSDDTVIAWAKDSLCDLALAGITDEQEAECIIASVRYGNCAYPPQPEGKVNKNGTKRKPTKKQIKEWEERGVEGVRRMGRAGACRPRPEPSAHPVAGRRRHHRGAPREAA